MKKIKIKLFGKQRLKNKKARYMKMYLEWKIAEMYFDKLFNNKK